LESKPEIMKKGIVFVDFKWSKKTIPFFDISGPGKLVPVLFYILLYSSADHIDRIGTITI